MTGDCAKTLATEADRAYADLVAENARLRAALTTLLANQREPNHCKGRT